MEGLLSLALFRLLHRLNVRAVNVELCLIGDYEGTSTAVVVSSSHLYYVSLIAGRMMRCEARPPRHVLARPLNGTG